MNVNGLTGNSESELPDFDKILKTLNCFFSTLGYSFSVICFSETLLDDTDSNSLYELPNYSANTK